MCVCVCFNIIYLMYIFHAGGFTKTDRMQKKNMILLENLRSTA